MKYTDSNITIKEESPCLIAYSVRSPKGRSLPIKSMRTRSVSPFMTLIPRLPPTSWSSPSLIASVAEVTEDNAAVVAHIFAVISKVTKQLGLESYRVVSNIGEQAGQTVHHLHFHVLSGRDMTWPPG